MKGHNCGVDPNYNHGAATVFSTRYTYLHRMPYISICLKTLVFFLMPLLLCFFFLSFFSLSLSVKWSRLLRAASSDLWICKCFHPLIWFYSVNLCCYLHVSGPLQKAYFFFLKKKCYLLMGHLWKGFLFLGPNLILHVFFMRSILQFWVVRTKGWTTYT